jgi:hypothetical protein
LNLLLKFNFHKLLYNDLTKKQCIKIKNFSFQFNKMYFLLVTLKRNTHNPLIWVLWKKNNYFISQKFILNNRFSLFLIFIQNLKLMFYKLALKINPVIFREILIDFIITYWLHKIKIINLRRVLLILIYVIINL